MYRVLFTLTLLFALPASAQDVRLLVSNGSTTGTYKLFTGVIQKNCNDTIPLVDVDSSGAVENLSKLTENEANAAFMHEDVILWRGMSEPSLKTSLRTLLVLWPEDVHFIVKNQPFVTDSGHFGIGRKERNLQTLTDLEGLKVGAAGGGYVSAQRIRYVGEVKYEVAQYDSGKMVLEALGKGEIAAAVFVGAAPLPNIATLGHDYRILQIGEGVREKLTKVGYHTATVTYTKMNVGAVTTVAANALLVAQQYKSAKWLGALAKFRQCFREHLDEIRETPGMHKAWKKVEPDKVSEWPMYEGLDNAAATANPVVTSAPTQASVPAVSKKKRRVSTGN